MPHVHDASSDAMAPRQALLNDLMLDMIANTDCSWKAATAAIAFWEYHYIRNTAPVSGVVDYEDERSNVVYDCGKKNRSLKIGVDMGDHDTYWMITIQS